MSDFLKVLYIDCSQSGSELVRAVLEEAGVQCHITEVATQIETEAELCSGGYALVLFELVVADIACLNLLDFVRAHYPRLPAIIIAASGSEEIAVECMKRGAADYVMKSAQHLQRLPHVIEAALERSRLRIERERMTEQIAYQAQLLANVNDAVISTDANFILTAWNHAAERMYGWKSTEAIGRPLRDVIRSELTEAERTKAYEILAKQGQHRLELLLYGRDGKGILTECNSTALHDDTGQISSYVTVIRDITERKQAEERLWQSEKRYKHIAENVPGVVYQWLIRPDNSTEWLFMSEGSRRLFGVDPEFIRQNPTWPIEATHPDDRPHLERSIAESLATLQPWHWEGRIVLPDGDIRWVQGTSRLQKQDNGDVLADGLFLDITERKQMEQSLLKSQQDMGNILESITEAFYALNREWEFTYVNDAGYRLHSRQPGSLLGKNLWHEFPEAVSTVYQQHYEKAMYERVEVTFEAYYAPLETWGEVRVYPFEDGISVYISDVTERRRNEEMLREMELRFRSLADANIMGVAVSGMDGIIYEANDFLLNLLGYSRQEFEENKLRWDAITPPEYAPLDAKAVANFTATGVVSPFEKEYIRKDGSRVSVLLSGTTLDSASGKGLFLVLDLTWKKRAERESNAYAAKLERSNRELQEFAFIASHDLQEPLRKIEAFAERLQEDYASALGAEGTDYLQRLQSATQRMRAFISDLLTLSRVETSQQPIAPIDLAQIAGEVLSDLETQITETGARVEMGDLGAIEADPLQMRQILQNLIGNALKFQQQGQPPFVRVQGQLMPPQETAVVPMYQISITDNGIGFDDKQIERIFQPFVRLHGRSRYQGTGMGLALCRKIAERHGGSITATSTVGQGSTFIVTLPVKQLRHP